MRPRTAIVLGLWIAGCSPSSTDRVADTDTDTDAPVAVPNDAQPLRLLLHGGGAADTVTFTRFVHAARGGPVVTLGALDPSDPHLLEWDPWWRSLGATDAVTLNLVSREEADAADSADTLRSAGAIFIRNGDVASMRSAWAGTGVEAALRDAVARGVPLGGSASGATLLGEQMYVPDGPSVESFQAVTDPFLASFSLTPGLTGALPGVVVDTDVAWRARLGRLAVFLARLASPTGPAVGLGLDSQTSLLVWEDGTSEVAGQGAVTVLHPGVLGGAAPFDLQDAPLWHLTAGYTLDLQAGDPVVSRPTGVAPVAVDPPTPSWPDTTVFGDDRDAGEMGEWAVAGTKDPDGWWDGALRVGPGSARLTGLTVLPAMFGDADLFGAVQAASLLALTTNPGSLVLGVDVGDRVRVAGASMTPRAGDVAWVLDGRGLTWAGVQDSGWRTPAFEGARLNVVSRAWSASAP